MKLYRKRDLKPVQSIKMFNILLAVKKFAFLENITFIYVTSLMLRQ